MNTDLVFYGTSAAEGIPSPFCDCYLCKNAREQGGKEVRRRSMFRIDETTVIDLGADAFSQSIDFGDFIRLEHALITHTHEDHFAYMMMSVRGMATLRIEQPLNLYFTDAAYDIIDFYCTHSAILKGSVRKLEQTGVVAFHRLEFGKTYSIGSTEVTPLKGNHFGNMGENSANYIIKLHDGKTLFYGLDTGYYLEETFQELKRYKLDYYISECTYGNAANRPLFPDGHLDVSSCMRIFTRLLTHGVIDKNTKIYITHINHSHTATHQELSRIFNSMDFPCKISVAYDGMHV